MPNKHIRVGTIRKLWPVEKDKFRDHLLRLDTASRRMRFAHAVSDSFILDYANRMSENGAIIYAYIVDDQVCAVAELRKIGDTWGSHAEAAFSVESAYQQQGLATELLGRCLRSARNRGVTHLLMSCLSDNAKMQAVARHHEAELHFDHGEVIGEITPDSPNPLSIFAEAVEDRMDYLMAILDLRTHHGKPAPAEVPRRQAA